MERDDSDFSPQRPVRTKPIAILGAGKLVSSVWKDIASVDSAMRFNLYRTGANGRVGYRFRPSDVHDLLKVVRLLAVTILDEGGCRSDERSEFKAVVAMLDQGVIGRKQETNVPGGSLSRKSK